MLCKPRIVEDRRVEVDVIRVIFYIISHKIKKKNYPAQIKIRGGCQLSKHLTLFHILTPEC